MTQIDRPQSQTVPEPKSRCPVRIKAIIWYLQRLIGEEMANWTEDQLAQIDAAKELEITSRRSDGSLRGWLQIWVVRADGGVVARTWRRRTTGWFGHVVKGKGARIRVPGLETEVSVEDLGGGPDDLRARVDDAYRTSTAGTPRTQLARWSTTQQRPQRCVSSPTSLRQRVGARLQGRPAPVLGAATTELDANQPGSLLGLIDRCADVDRLRATLDRRDRRRRA